MDICLQIGEIAPSVLRVWKKPAIFPSCRERAGEQLHHSIEVLSACFDPFPEDTENLYRLRCSHEEKEVPGRRDGKFRLRLNFATSIQFYLR